jgi:predicted DNA-binding protein (UPF0251 family)
MTNDEFDSLILPVQMSFRESESVRLVLVHEFSIQLASKYYGVDTVKISELIDIINASG